jgi:probable HAF family extracellular repeat protein/T5SS/PEP-CTERM-associated repeat protein
MPNQKSANVCAEGNSHAMRRRILVLLLLAALLLLPGAAHQAPAAQAAPRSDPPARPRYTVTDLGALAGDFSQAWDINDKGQVVGQTQVNIATPEGLPYHAFIWERGVMTDVGTLGGYMSIAWGINNAGQVVGWSHTASGGDDDAAGPAHAAQATAGNGAFLWQNGVMQPLASLGGTNRTARAVNDSGQVVGVADNRDVTDPENPREWARAVRWASGVLDLGTLGGNKSAAHDINNVGQIVGTASIAGDRMHAFLWQNGTMQDLGTLVGDYSEALAINNAGQVVGISSAASGWHAFLWDGAMHSLGTLGGLESRATDINEHGQVVGESIIGDQRRYHAFLWENGQMKDLNELVPAASGWVLVSAEAINNHGQIVGWGSISGQTHAFLLTPIAYYWDNPSGGAWYTATNWDPQGIPGEGDTTIFELAGEYTVDAAPPPAAASATANQLSSARLVVTGTATVNFNNLDLNLTYDSPAEPSLVVSGGGTANINSGAATFSHAIVGGLAPDDPNNPPTARLQIFNRGTSLTGSGRLAIGDEGVGDLFVANGGHLTSAEARLGGAQPGSAAVGGDGSLWQTGNIAIGYGVSGTLTIENGGRVDSNAAVVGFGASTHTSEVKVDFDALSPGPVSLWAVEDNLTIGPSGAGLVDVANGGQLAVNQNVSILDGMLKVMGHTATDAASLLEVLGSVSVGGPNTGVLYLDDGARGNVHGDLSVGQDGIGHVYVAGGMDVASRLEVKDPTWGTCLIGREFPGRVIVTGYAALHCRNIQLGLAGTGGAGRINLDGGYVSAGEIVRVGQAGSGGGRIEMENSATIVAGEGMYIAPNGAVAGAGYIYLGTIGLLNEGTLSPGVNVTVVPLANPAQQRARNQPLPGTMSITGTLTISPTGRLAIPVAGSNPGQYGRLAVAGAAHLDGVLVLDFQNGYAPRAGATFTFLTATGGITGAFDRVEVTGLPLGFVFDLAVADGQVLLKVLSVGTPETLFLPMVLR